MVSRGVYPFLLRFLAVAGQVLVKRLLKVFLSFPLQDKALDLILRLQSSCLLCPEAHQISFRL